MNCPECANMNTNHNATRINPIPTTVPMTWIPWLKSWVCSWCGLTLGYGAVWTAPAASSHSNNRGRRKGGHHSAAEQGG